MATNIGTATIDFGGAPGGNEAQANVIGQSAISATSKADVFVMGDDTSLDHTAADHRYLPLLASFICGTPVAGTGFTIYGRSLHMLTGRWTVRWIWAD